MFPKGAPGEIYSHMWRSQLAAILAPAIDLLPGWSPAGEATAPTSAPASPAEPRGELPLNAAGAAPSLVAPEYRSLTADPLPLTMPQSRSPK